MSKNKTFFGRIFITGGAGYVGSALVPKLLERGYSVTVLDLAIYGANVLPKHKNLKVMKGDIRDKELLGKALPGHDVVIHLACISNDPSFELNPDLGRSINLDAFRPLVEISRDSGVKRFIYASSSSVYGIKEEKDVHEDMSLEPLTDYSKFKAECEKILSEYQTNNFTTVTLRPATVCGYSKRQRLDVVVNIFCNLGYHNREITVFGGKQLRPNIHIQDMCDAYILLLEVQKTAIEGEIYNVGDNNYTVIELAQMVRSVIGNDVKLTTVSTNDNRSYHISSKKILKELNYRPKYGILKAIEDMKEAFDRGLLPNALTESKYFNVKKMKETTLS